MYTVYIVKYDKELRELDEAAWLEEVGFVESRMGLAEAYRSGRSTRRFNREECYDLRRMRMGPRPTEGNQK